MWIMNHKYTMMNRHKGKWARTKGKVIVEEEKAKSIEGKEKK
jgi:hypothetical protein